MLRDLMVNNIKIDPSLGWNRIGVPVQDWLTEFVLDNISNPPEVDFRTVIPETELQEDEPANCRVPNPDKSGGWEDSELEPVDFENVELVDFNLETNTLVIEAGGDWQEPPFHFSLTLQDDGTWKYNGDLRPVVGQMGETCEDKIEELLNTSP